MDWAITLDEEKRYAEVVTAGVADRQGTLEMAKEIAAFAREKKIKKILIDHRSIGAVSGGIVEVYQRPKELKEKGAILGIKVAEVVNAEHKPFFRFLETVCVTRGLLFLSFEDKDAALKWLLSSDSNPIVDSSDM